jgi:inorganic pyrophosphatase
MTWEDPNEIDEFAGHPGDNDPLDICEIGLRIMKVAEIAPGFVCYFSLLCFRADYSNAVKVIGVLCLIDEGKVVEYKVFFPFNVYILGETDWKVIAISTTDPWSGLLHDISDVERLLPGTLESIKEWFRTYKMFDGKPENQFGMNGEFQSADFAKGVIHRAHLNWRKLLSGFYANNASARSPVISGHKGETKSSLPNAGLTERLYYPGKSDPPPAPSDAHVSADAEVAGR